MPIFLDIVNEIKSNFKIEAFDIPSNIKFLKINKETGLQTRSNENYIYEAFKLNDPVPLEELNEDEEF